MEQVLGILIIILSVFSISRIFLGLTISNIHQIHFLGLSDKEKVQGYQPLVSVVIPAYNEEKLIKRCVMSALESDYPNKQVIVVDDGSADQTLAIIQKIKQDYPELEIISQKNSGKATAINNAVKKYATGELVSVLDADSHYKKDALSKMVPRFQDQRVIAMSANVRISFPEKFIDWVQKVEYLMGYRLKGSEQLLGFEYIIGGIGSTFRRSAMLEVGLYDLDTVTEDIDFTMKLIAYYGNKDYIFGYGNDAIVYTPSVHTFMQLIKQRYRWKYGRFKALAKYHQLIFSRDSKYTKLLTFWKLPKVFFEETILLIDPIMNFLLLFVIVQYGDVTSILSVMLIYFIFAFSSFAAEDYMSKKERAFLFFLAPVAYCFLFIINIVDYINLVRCIADAKNIIMNTQKVSTWEHVAR